jgi:two-component system, OmpR family, sensor kinase
MTFGAAAADRWQALRQFPGRIPLRVKLITAVLTLVAIALIAISVAGISFLRTYLISETDGSLRPLSQTTGQIAVQHCLFDGGQACNNPAQSGLAVYWLPQRGAIVPVMVPATPSGLSYRKVPPPAVAPAANWLLRHPWQVTTVPAKSGNGRWRVISYPAAMTTQAGTQVGTVVAGIDVTDVYRTVGRLVTIDLIVSAIIVAALAVVGVAIVRSSLRPLTDIERTAQKIASGDLSQRVPDRDPRTEVGRLGQALNTMLSQVEAAFHARAESERAARNSEERMRQFVADASHELRTPVTVIRGYAEYYRQRGGLEPGAATANPAGPAPAGTAPTAGAGHPGNGSGPPPASLPDAALEAAPLGQSDMDRIIERVEQESARMGGLVEDLLLLARLDQQRPVERRPVDLLTLAGDAVQDARAIAPDRQIGLSVGTGTAFIVLGDEARLRQVIGNLMSNALTHTPGGTPIEMRIHAGGTTGHPPQPAVLLEVADQGPGMTPEQASRAFERFYRADQSRERRTGGTGLGLAIVSALVTAHGGTVSLDTSPGEGATFRITLPLAPEARHEDTDR